MPGRRAAAGDMVRGPPAIGDSELVLDCAGVEPMIYEDVLRALTRAGVQFAIAGGIAVNLHGVPRLTQDLDILVEMSRDNLLLLVECLSGLGYRPRAPVDPAGLADPAIRRDWIESKGLKAFSFVDPNTPFNVVDILLDVPVTYESAVPASSKVQLEDDLEVRLVSIDDLIRMKESARRAQDLSDIEHLRRVKARREIR